MIITDFLIKEKPELVIYGAGKVGLTVLSLLQSFCLLDRVTAVAVTDACGNPENILLGGRSIPVRPLSEFSADDKSSCVWILSAEVKVVSGMEELCGQAGVRKLIRHSDLFADISRLEKKNRDERRNNVNQYLLNEHRPGGRNRIRAAHVTYPYVGNAGDTYLSWCVRHYLDFSEYEIIPVDAPVSVELVDKINRTDLCVIGGGGLFLPDTNENSISGWQWAIAPELLDMIRVPIIVYAVGYNYFPGQQASDLFRKELNHLVRKSSFFGMRNGGSIRSVRSLLDESLRKKVVFQPCVTTIAESFIAQAAGSRAETACIAFNVAFDRSERRFGGSEKAILCQLVKAAKKIQQEGFRIFYAAHCFNDLKFIPALRKADVDCEIVSLETALPDEVADFYSKMQVVIGMRGHSQMIPFGLGRGIVTLGTHDKMRWFLEDVDMMECYVDLKQEDDLLPDRILDAFHLWLSEPSNVVLREKQRLAMKRLLSVSEENRKKIIRCVEEQLKIPREESHMMDINGKSAWTPAPTARGG